MLLELRPDERQRERRSVDLSVEERHQVRHAADVILVTVRQHQRGHAPVLQIRQILDDQVHARQLGPGEHATGVDDDGGLAARDGQHVQAELAEAAQGHDLDGWSAGLWPGVCDGHRCPSAGMPAAEAFVSDTQILSRASARAITIVRLPGLGGRIGPHRRLLGAPARRRVLGPKL